MNLEASLNEFAVFTVCNLAYLPRTLVLADSLYKYHRKKLCIFLFDTKTDKDITDTNANIYWLEEMNIPHFREMAFKYDIIEFSTSLKPYITLDLLKRYERVIFMDPDTCLFNPLQPVLEALDKNSIFLTPHYTTPQPNNLQESDIGMMRFGSFNLGFYAVRRSEQSLGFLSWWSQRCLDLCYMESQFGLSTDQKWVAIAPCLFHDIHVSFHLGLNVAAWNSWERKLSRDAIGNYWVNQTYPLIFFHFSNFDHNDVEYFNKRSGYEVGIRRPDLYEIGLWYSSKLKAKGSGDFGTRYAYDYMSDGSYISPTLRRAYACVLPELPEGHDPFDAQGVVGKFARKNFLLEKCNLPYKREGATSLSGNQGKLNLIYTSMRLLLRVIGPNKFMNISRLLVYLSSYRQNRGLWKL